MPWLRFADGDQRVGFCERSGDGLFDEHVDSGFEQAAADARMLGGGDGEADGVNAVGRERVEIAKNARAEFCGDFLRRVRRSCRRCRQARRLRFRARRERGCVRNHRRRRRLREWVSRSRFPFRRWNLRCR